MPIVMESLYRIAESQAGYFTTAQARAAGVSRQELYFLRKSGDLLQVAYGIQRLARFPANAHEDIVVACLWAGSDAVASHESALVVYGIGEAMPPVIHVTVPRPFRGRRKGVRVHHADLASDERARRDGVPVTSPLRTIADIASHDLPGASVALTDALEGGLIRKGQLDQAAEKYPVTSSVFGNIR